MTYSKRHLSVANIAAIRNQQNLEWRRWWKLKCTSENKNANKRNRFIYFSTIFHPGRDCSRWFLLNSILLIYLYWFTFMSSADLLYFLRLILSVVFAIEYDYCFWTLHRKTNSQVFQPIFGKRIFRPQTEIRYIISLAVGMGGFTIWIMKVERFHYMQRIHTFACTFLKGWMFVSYFELKFSDESKNDVTERILKSIAFRLITSAILEILLSSYMDHSFHEISTDSKSKIEKKQSEVTCDLVNQPFQIVFY